MLRFNFTVGGSQHVDNGYSETAPFWNKTPRNLVEMRQSFGGT
jgi:hypothetical protein